MGRYNDLDLSRWKDYNDIETDSYILCKLIWGV